MSWGEQADAARYGPHGRVLKQPMDKRSSPGSAATATSRLRAIGIEREPLNERMARTVRTSFEIKAVSHGGRFPRGSGKPFGAIEERGFPPPAPFAGDAGSLRPRPRRPAALRLEKRQGQRCAQTSLCHGICLTTDRDPPPGNYAGKSHGLTSATPMPSKSLILRVTSVIRRVRAVAAI